MKVRVSFSFQAVVIVLLCATRYRIEGLRRSAQPRNDGLEAMRPANHRIMDCKRFCFGLAVSRFGIPYLGT